MLENSIVGPSVSLGKGAVIRNSIVQDSIVSENAEVTDCLLSGSIVADNAKVTGHLQHLNVGDSSEINIG